MVIIVDSVDSVTFILEAHEARFNRRIDLKHHLQRLKSERGKVSLITNSNNNLVIFVNKSVRDG